MWEYFLFTVAILAILAVLWIAFVYFVDQLLPNWIYRGPKTDHFDGRRFFFPGVPKRTPIDIFRWLLTRRPATWPAYRPIQEKFPHPLSKTIDDQPIVTFIGHASILLQWKHLNILIDPVYDETLGPQFCTWFNIKRVHEPGVNFNDLPHIDLILVSHSHYDHMDVVVLKKLSDLYQPLIITGLGNKTNLNNAGIQNVIELDWWQSNVPAVDFEITYTPAVHSSNRSLFDVDFTLWGGFAIAVKNQGYIYFSSDSGYGPHWVDIKNKLGSPLLAILPIGAYEARWFMKRVHMNPEDMLKTMQDLSPKYGMAVHFGMFPLADEGIDDPVNLLSELMSQQNLTHEYIWIPTPGESKKIPL